MAADFDVIPINKDIDGKGYSDFIKDYWHFLLGDNPNDPVYKNTIFTRGSQDYRDIHSIEKSKNAAVQRKNFAGLKETPGEYTKGSQNKPLNTSKYPVFITVLDTIALESEIDENGREVTQDEVLKKENDVVKPEDVKLTIQKIGGSESVVDLSDIVFKNHRTKATFDLEVPQESVLAERLEYKIKPRKYPDAQAEGYYVLIKFNNPGVYNIKSVGKGVRGYISKADYYIEIP
jgi:hypothetical protein